MVTSRQTKGEIVHHLQSVHRALSQNIKLPKLICSLEHEEHFSFFKENILNVTGNVIGKTTVVNNKLNDGLMIPFSWVGFSVLVLCMLAHDKSNCCEKGLMVL